MAYANDGERKSFKPKILLVVSESGPEAKYPWKIQVVQWIVDGKPTPPKLERRDYYTHEETGELRMGKVKGFSVKDLDVIQDQWGEIMEAIKGTAKEPAGAAAGSDVEDQPF